MNLLQSSLWSVNIIASLELLLLASVAIVCLPFTRAARLGKPDKGGMFKMSRPSTKTDMEPPGSLLPREVNKYLNRWKPSRSMLFLLTLLCTPNLASGGPYGRDAPNTWKKDSPEARDLPFPINDVLESTCRSIVGCLRSLWDGGADFDPQCEMVRNLFLAISDLRVTAGRD